MRNILYETVRGGRVALLKLNRPRYRNALSRVLVDALDKSLEVAVADANVRVIVLAGVGKDFCAGHDLGSPEELADRDIRKFPEGFRGRYERSFMLDTENMLKWRRLPKPTIAAVHGHCIFAGWMLASSMDLVFAAEDAQLLATHFPYFSVPWDMGTRKAKEIIFENRFLSGKEAADLGFVNRALPAGELLNSTLDYAERVAENDPFHLRMSKFAINQAQDIQGFTAYMLGAPSNYFVGALGTEARAPGQRRHKIVATATGGSKAPKASSTL